MIDARLVDVGLLEPAMFHASYTGIANAMGRDAPPVVMWGRAKPHLSLGQSQDASAELASGIDVPVVSRPLGGGAVWVDESQYCFVLIALREHAPQRPSEWFEWGLAPAVATYRRFGLPVARREQDMWLHGRKIGGSGAATIGRCAVFASSFLLRFPAERFAHCVTGPLGSRVGQDSPAFRKWLLAGLEQAMTDWEAQQVPPAPDELHRAFCNAVEKNLGWRLSDSVLSEMEHAARSEALQEIAELAQQTKRRLVPDGIKLNAVTFLTEKREGSHVVRELTVDGRVVRRDLATA